MVGGMRRALVVTLSPPILTLKEIYMNFNISMSITVFILIALVALTISLVILTVIGNSTKKQLQYEIGSIMRRSELDIQLNNIFCRLEDLELGRSQMDRQTSVLKDLFNELKDTISEFHEDIERIDAVIYPDITETRQEIQDLKEKEVELVNKAYKIKGE